MTKVAVRAAVAAVVALIWPGHAGWAGGCAPSNLSSFSRLGEVIDLGVAHGFVDKSGSWYSYKGDRIGQGKDNARTFLQENPAMAAEIEAAIRAKLLPGKAEHAVHAAAGEEETA